jgi:tRNA threonylcarbamoyladenosine biosynthesis protein TsaE
VSTQTFDETALVAFGTRLAECVRSGDVIELIGDIGAGKTTLTRSIAQAMGITVTIQSPTFAISNRYPLPDGGVLVHYDFYRLSDPGIMRDELDETMHDPSSVVIIEWGDIVRDILPNDRLTITITTPTDTTRQVTVDAHGALRKRYKGYI